MPLSVSGLKLDVVTVLDIINRVATTAEVAAPGFATLLEAVLSTFSGDAKDEIMAAYEARKAQSDTDHANTQEALQKEAEKGEAPPADED